MECSCPKRTATRCRRLASVSSTFSNVSERSLVTTPRRSPQRQPAGSQPGGLRPRQDSLHKIGPLLFERGSGPHLFGPQVQNASQISPPPLILKQLRRARGPIANRVAADDGAPGGSPQQLAM